MKMNIIKVTTAVVVYGLVVSTNVGDLQASAITTEFEKKVLERTTISDKVTLNDNAGDEQIDVETIEVKSIQSTYTGSSLVETEDGIFVLSQAGTYNVGEIPHGKDYKIIIASDGVTLTGTYAQNETYDKVIIEVNADVQNLVLDNLSINNYHQNAQSGKDDALIKLNGGTCDLEIKGNNIFKMSVYPDVQEFGIPLILLSDGTAINLSGADNNAKIESLGYNQIVGAHNSIAGDINVENLYINVLGAINITTQVTVIGAYSDNDEVTEVGDITVKNTKIDTGTFLKLYAAVGGLADEMGSIYVENIEVNADYASGMITAHGYLKDGELVPGRIATVNGDIVVKNAEIVATKAVDYVIGAGTATHVKGDIKVTGDINVKSYIKFTSEKSAMFYETKVAIGGGIHSRIDGNVYSDGNINIRAGSIGVGVGTNGTINGDVIVDKVLNIYSQTEIKDLGIGISRGGGSINDIIIKDGSEVSIDAAAKMVVGIGSSAVVSANDIIVDGNVTIKASPILVGIGASHGAEANEVIVNGDVKLIAIKSTVAKAPTRVGEEEYYLGNIMAGIGTYGKWETDKNKEVFYPSLSAVTVNGNIYIDAENELNVGIGAYSYGNITGDITLSGNIDTIAKKTKIFAGSTQSSQIEANDKQVKFDGNVIINSGNMQQNTAGIAEIPVIMKNNVDAKPLNMFDEELYYYLVNSDNVSENIVSLDDNADSYQYEAVKSTNANFTEKIGIFLPDRILPIEVLQPENGATEVAVDTNIVVKFIDDGNENIYDNTKLFHLYAKNKDKEIAIDVKYNNNNDGSFTITPKVNLAEGTKYYLTVDKGIITDKAIGYHKSAGIAFGGYAFTTFGTPAKDEVVVTFDFNSPLSTVAMPSENVKIEEGTKVEAKAVTYAADGYEFLGWVETKESPLAKGEVLKVALFDFNKTIDANKTLYAQWRATSGGSNPTNPKDKVVVTFDFNSPLSNITMPNEDITINKGDKTTAKTVTYTANGYEFLGWVETKESPLAVGEALKVALFDFDTAIDTNKTLYAQWRATGQSVKPDDKEDNGQTVIQDGNGGGGTDKPEPTKPPVVDEPTIVIEPEEVPLAPIEVVPEEKPEEIIVVAEQEVPLAIAPVKKVNPKTNDGKNNMSAILAVLLATLSASLTGAYATIKKRRNG